MATNVSNSSLALTPLGAGDLIDRTVRFYRKNFWTFIFIASPPIVLGTLISIGWTFLGRQLFNIGAGSLSADNSVSAMFFNFLGAILIFLIELIITLSVMGGASRNFVRHILFGETITFRETYANTRTRFFGLLAASLLITIILGVVAFIVFYIGILLAFVAIALVSLVLMSIPPIAVVVSALLTIGVLFLSGWLFFIVAARFAYVPQIMLVEGQSVASAISRSTSLASGNSLRIYALFVFTFSAIFSAMLLFYGPLGWLAYTQGIEIFSSDPNAMPAWYVVANQIVTQSSIILLSPILMIGLCLLYVDERVRNEGYDIELMAARNLGEIPAVPSQYSNPLQPALADKTTAPSPRPAAGANKSGSMLGLE
jgi:hypothetical protein